MCNLHHIFLILSVVLLSVLPPRLVEGNCEDQVCDNLNSIDTKLPNWWNFVHFRTWVPVKLKYLGSNAFKHRTNLEYITITKMVRGIDGKAFKGLYKLFAVVLEDNVLEVLPRNLFEGCPLQKIVIRNCRVEKIEKGIFDNQPKLTHLTIEGNKFQEVKTALLPRELHELVLRKNGITFIEEDAFYDMTKLQKLDLSENFLASFEFRRYLINTPKLVEIKLNGNHLQELYRLPALSHLRYLYLENNLISRIDNTAFDSCPNLEVLHLSHNHIEDLETSYFPETGLQHLRRLHLSYNNVTCITDNILDLFPNLKVLWFGMNPLNCMCFNDINTYINMKDISHPYHFKEEWDWYNKCDNSSTVSVSSS